MSRAMATDPYHAFKYHVKATTTGVGGGSDIGSDKQGGFNSVTMPDATLEAVEYKEGTFVYKRKYPGDVSFSDMTLSRGTMKKDTAFYDWVRAGYLGQEYRCDLVIMHFHRDDIKGLMDYSKVDAKRQIKVFEAMPIRFKPGSDFDAATSDISLQELDVALEYFEIEDKNS